MYHYFKIYKSDFYRSIVVALSIPYGAVFFNATLFHQYMRSIVAVSFTGGGNRSIKRYETSISYFMSNITIEIYTMFLLIHVENNIYITLR
jgi:hypothetical protein